MAIGANPAGAFFEVTPIMTMRNSAVSAENSAAPQTALTSMKVPMNSAPSRLSSSFRATPPILRDTTTKSSGGYGY